MDGQRAWRQWWLTATISTVALVSLVVITATGPSQLDWWALAPTLVGFVAVLLGTFLNRPRPFAGARGVGSRGAEQRAAYRAVRRGIPVDPVDRQREAVEVVRREWYSISTQIGMWSVLAVNWNQQRADSPGELFFTITSIVGDVALLAGILALAFSGRVLRRLDSLEAGSPTRLARSGFDGRFALGVEHQQDCGDYWSRTQRSGPEQPQPEGEARPADAGDTNTWATIVMANADPGTTVARSPASQILTTTICRKADRGDDSAASRAHSETARG